MAVMPLYYFDIHNGNGVVRDTEGSEMPNLQAAQREAVMAIADMASSHCTADATHRFSIAVKNEREKQVLFATLTLELKED